MSMSCFLVSHPSISIFLIKKVVKSFVIISFSHLCFEEESRNDIGAKKLIHEDSADAKTKTLMHRWRFPSLSLHGWC